MYPNAYYAFKDIFGVEWHGLQAINTFGVFMAISFFLAAFVFYKELRRKSAEGLLGYEEEKIIIGKPVNPVRLLAEFLIAFVFGYKLIGLFGSGAENAQDYIKSLAGSWPGGIALGLFNMGLKWRDVHKNKLPAPEERTIRIWAYDRIADLTGLAAIFGFAGAKIFNSLETWDDFVQSPFDSLFSFSGLTFYGGLICAALAIWWYAKKHHINFWHLNDAAAPMLMLAYAVGRIGCQVSGDGDWGIPNSAYTSTPDGKAVLDTAGRFAQTVAQNQPFYTNEFGSLDKIRHLSVKAPSFLPDWLFAYPYPHNVNNVGARLADCAGQHCYYLPVPVFPTPVYETMMGLVLFAVIWYLRKKLKVPGALFSIYLILNGLERFFIEKIRVNTTYDIFGLRPTQAELISSALIITGCVCYFQLNRKSARIKNSPAA
jgi:phosphatidylglycerol:prolipoprotein diacylglycerol transferase